MLKYKKEELMRKYCCKEIAVRISRLTLCAAAAGGGEIFMDARITEFFKNEKIEYFAALPYSDCREINSAIIEREEFQPKSVIIFLLPYYSGETENLSVYSASLDYHIIIKDITSRLSALISEIYPESRSRGYGDHSPIDERHAALISGLGILGDNGLLLNKKYGSYIFIADLVTDIEPSIMGVKAPCEIENCEHCGACKKACPTKILSGEGGDCLSAITQRKGELSENEISLMIKYNTVWGCDECQKACPYNKKEEITPLGFFKKDRIPRLTTEAVNAMDKAEFSRRAFAWRGRKTVLRNLKIFDL